MASYQAKLDLLVSGTDRLKKLEKQLNEFENKINNLNKQKLSVADQDAIKEAVDGAKQFVAETDNAVKATRKQLVQQIKLNGAVRLYGRRLKEATNIGVAKAEDRKALDELQAAFEVFKGAGDVEGVQAVATEVGRIVEANRKVVNQTAQINKNQSEVVKRQKEINAFAEQGLDVGKARQKLTRAQSLASTARLADAKEALASLGREISLLREKSNELKKQQAFINKQRGSALIGGAFPLLFGQGPGAAVGGAIGGAVGESLGVGGFAGSLAGTTIGNALDTAVQKAAELGNALNSATQNMQGLRDAGVEVTAQAQLQVEAALKLGDAVSAQRIATQAVAQQTGDFDGRLSRLASGSLSELQKAWNGILNAVSTTVGVLAAPFVNALAGILRVAQGVFVAFNGIVAAAEKLLRLVPGFGFITDALANQALVTSQAYQERQVELTKEAQALEKNLAIQATSLSIAKQSIGLSDQQNKLLQYQGKRLEIIAENNKKVQEARVRLGAARTPEERKNQQRIIFNLEKTGKNELAALDLSIEKNLYDTRVANNKNIADFNKTTSKQIEQLAISAERKIKDERLKAQRAVEDARLRGLQASLDLEIRLTRQTQQRRNAAAEVQKLYRTVGANLSGNPQAALEAELTNAVTTYRNAILKTQEDKALSEKKIALDLRKATISIERLKKDNATAIARLNLDNQKKVTALEEKIADKKRAVELFRLGVVKFEAETQTRSTIANLEADTARRRKAIEAQQTGAMGQRRNLDDSADPVIAQNIAAVETLNEALEESNKQFQEIQNKIPKLTAVLSDAPGAAQIPDFFGDVGIELQQQEEYIAGLQRRLAEQTAITEQEKAAAELITSAIGGLVSQSAQLDNIGESLRQRAAYEKLYQEQVQNGVNPALAEQLITTRLIGDQLVTNIDTIIRTLEGLEGFEEDIKRLMALKGDVEGRVVSLQASQIQQFKGPLEQFIKTSTDQLRDLESVGVQVAQGIGDAIGNSLASGITSLIEGSESVQEVFANMLKSIGQVLVQEGTKMIATYIAIGIAKAFAGMGSSTPKIGTDTNYFSQEFTLMNFFQPRANGGPVNRNSTYMVGENGPELFRPTQAGRIDSTSDLRSAMSRQQSSAPALNFSFETTNIGGTEYVSREQLEAAMAVTRKQAASDGAKRGMNMTLDKMQHSPATRRRVGI